jgi:hypothetical protein
VAPALHDREARRLHVELRRGKGPELRPVSRDDGGAGLERVTAHEGFDGFRVFSPDRVE